jgi:hypothetical protein
MLFEVFKCEIFCKLLSVKEANYVMKGLNEVKRIAGHETGATQVVIVFTLIYCSQN